MQLPARSRSAPLPERYFSGSRQTAERNPQAFMNTAFNMHKLYLLFFCFLFSRDGFCQEWQWMVPADSLVSTETGAPPKAFLWIPPGCRQVRGVVVGQHNMLEEGIFEHPAFRREMARLGFAEVWISPMFYQTFDFHKGAGQ